MKAHPVLPPPLESFSAEAGCCCSLQQLSVGAPHPPLPHVPAPRGVLPDTPHMPAAPCRCSCMVRGHPPALLALRGDGGLARLVGLLAQPEPRLQR